MAIKRHYVVKILLSEIFIAVILARVLKIGMQDPLHLSSRNTKLQPDRSKIVATILYFFLRIYFQLVISHTRIILRVYFFSLPWKLGR